jgi:hypothetical protein
LPSSGREQLMSLREAAAEFDEAIKTPNLVIKNALL